VAKGSVNISTFTGRVGLRKFKGSVSVPYLTGSVSLRMVPGGAVPWVLSTGIYNNAAFWKNTAIYKNNP